MKNKIWLLQLPVIGLFTGAFYISQLGLERRLESVFLREKVYPTLQKVVTLNTDLKFRLRGPQPAKNKIVIVEIDSNSVETIGRWPWHRDVQAALIQKSFDAGAAVVGLDYVNSEADHRVPKALREILDSQKLGEIAEQFETDHDFANVVKNNADKLVTGYTSEAVCEPLLDGIEACPVTNPDAIKTLPDGFDKFAFTHFRGAEGYNPEKTPFESAVTLIPNITEFDAFAHHSAYFNAFFDHDAYVRRTSLFMMINRKPFPSLPLEMARIGLKEELQLTLDKNQRVASLGFAKSGRTIPVNQNGVMEINFRGPGHSFPYVPAVDLLSDEDALKDELNRKLAGVSKKELLKDAYVLIGVSALGLNDNRNFPFETNVAGVEGHASILENILSGDPLHPASNTNSTPIILLLMIGGAMVFAWAAQRLEAVPALILFILTFSGLTLGDIKILFSRYNQNWNTSFLAIEVGAIFVFTLAVKYVMEERNKKFVKGAFAKYVSPAVVDSIIKDPTKLTVGGQKKDLTIMFSDIRSFTTFSERMDAKSLSTFLNDYLGTMTGLVFKHEGTLDKYIGDAVMAFWGAPLDLKLHAGNACRAAIDMMRALDENKARYMEQYGIDVNIGVGINSGAVSVGNMGSKDNFSYTVIGDHVNLSSRLEGLTKAYGVSILTTRFTFDEITKAGDTIPPHRVLDHVKVKGKKNAVELIEVCYKAYSPEGLQLFEEGRTLYTAQKWDDALAKFEKASKLLGATEAGDGPSLEYAQRCKDFKANPPGENWDGSWEMHSK